MMNHPIQKPTDKFGIDKHDYIMRESFSGVTGSPVPPATTSTPPAATPTPPVTTTPPVAPTIPPAAGGDGGGHWGGHHWGWGGGYPYFGIPYPYDPYWGRESVLYTPTTTDTVTLTDEEKKALKESLKNKKDTSGTVKSTESSGLHLNTTSTMLKNAGITIVGAGIGFGIAKMTKTSGLWGAVIGGFLGAVASHLIVTQK